MKPAKSFLSIVAGALSFFTTAQDIQCDLITNTTTYLPVPVIDKPDYLETITDPTFGTKITRIVGNPGDPITNISGKVWAAEQERHAYSKRSVWNCDQSMMYLERHYPNLWLDGETYEVLFTRTKPSSYVLWSHTEPDMMYHTGSSGNCHIGKWDVVNDISTELIDLRAYKSCTFGDGEGNFTKDGTKAAIYGKRISDNKYVVFMVDVVSKTKGTDIELEGIDLNNCTISPNGNFIVLNHNNDILTVLNAADGSLAWAETAYGMPSHFDVQLDQNGDEVVVGVAKSAPYNGWVIKRKLSDGTITPLTSSGYASHTSGRNLDRPGWVFVTYQNLQTNDKYLPFIGEMDAVRLDGTRVERICNLRVNKKLLPSDDQYYFEAHGCPSPDGLRVIFASDWDMASYPVQAYVVDFRDKVLPASIEDGEIPGTDTGNLHLNTYPNPFNKVTSIRFSTQKNGPGVLKVYDMMGKEVATLFDDMISSGISYTLRFDAGSLPAGMYSVTMHFENQFITNKVIRYK